MTARPDDADTLADNLFDVQAMLLALDGQMHLLSTDETAISVDHLNMLARVVRAQAERVEELASAVARLAPSEGDEDINHAAEGRGGHAANTARELGAGTLNLADAMTPLQARQVARAPNSAADAAEAMPTVRETPNAREAREAREGVAGPAPRATRCVVSQLQGGVDPEAVLTEIAHKASGLESLLIDTECTQDFNMISAAISMALHIGWLADRAAFVLGGSAATLRNGDAEQWLMPAAARRAAQGDLS